MGKSYAKKFIEEKSGKEIDVLLREEYLDNRLSIQQIADKWETTSMTVHKWLKEYNIPRRKLTFM